MADSKLSNYIASARSGGAKDDQIKAELLKSGWPESEVSLAFTPSQDSAINLPPPPVPHFGMWVAFEYIVLFITLYVSAMSLGGILNFAVDKSLPDRLNQSLSYSLGLGQLLLQGFLAGIIVCYPIFILLFIILRKQLIANQAIRNLRARKLLIYLTLLVTFLIMIGNIISVVFGFLSGNATTNSLAHFGVTVTIAGSIFLYLLLEVREDRKET